MQLSIDDVTFFQHKGNEYSKEANKSMRPSKAKLRGEVLSTIAHSLDGCTSDQVESILNASHQTISARMTELKALGLITLIGKRKTRSGRLAGVWRVK